MDVDGNFKNAKCRQDIEGECTPIGVDFGQEDGKVYLEGKVDGK